MQLVLRQRGSVALGFITKRPLDNLVNHQFCAFAHALLTPHPEPNPDFILLNFGLKADIQRGL